MQQDDDKDAERLMKWRRALDHWMQVGYSYDTARALASVLHGRDENVRAWAIAKMQTETSLRISDMV